MRPGTKGRRTMAKPENWDQMSEQEQDAVARELYEDTGRRNFIITEALVRARRAMLADARPAYSDIEDMELLLRVMGGTWMIESNEVAHLLEQRPELREEMGNS